MHHGRSKKTNFRDLIEHDDCSMFKFLYILSEEECQVETFVKTNPLFNTCIVNCAYVFLNLFVFSMLLLFASGPIESRRGCIEYKLE
jgi:hypothetical protein